MRPLLGEKRKLSDAAVEGGQASVTRTAHPFTYPHVRFGDPAPFTLPHLLLPPLGLYHLWCCSLKLSFHFTTTTNSLFISLHSLSSRPVAHNHPQSFLRRVLCLSPRSTFIQTQDSTRSANVWPIDTATNSRTDIDDDDDARPRSNDPSFSSPDNIDITSSQSPVDCFVCSLRLDDWNPRQLQEPFVLRHTTSQHHSTWSPNAPLRPAPVPSPCLLPRPRPSSSSCTLPAATTPPSSAWMPSSHPASSASTCTSSSARPTSRPTCPTRSCSRPAAPPSAPPMAR